MIWSRLAALGDSFTAGHGDAVDGIECRSWVEHLVERLRNEQPAFHSVNLARYGATLSVVVDTQLDLALQSTPDLVTMVTGANDVRASAWNVERFGTLLCRLIDTVRNAGATAVIGNVPNFALALPLRELDTKLELQRRIFEANDVIARAARDHGALLLDLANQRAPYDLRNYSRDLVHPNARGYALIAEYVHRCLTAWASEHVPKSPGATERPERVAHHT